MRGNALQRPSNCRGNTINETTAHTIVVINNIKTRANPTAGAILPWTWMVGYVISCAFRLDSAVHVALLYNKIEDLVSQQTSTATGPIAWATWLMIVIIFLNNFEKLHRY